MERIILINADVLSGLALLPDESVHCCVTSPPYWGLRDYGLEPQVLGAGNSCSHEWGDLIEKRRGGSGEREYGSYDGAVGRGPAVKLPLSSFCRLCGSWRGCLGLEPTPELYLEHMVAVFREVRRVLRKDGMLWLNMGDCYAGSGKAGSDPEYQKRHTQFGQKERKERLGVPTGVPAGLKPKDLCGMPWRLALALQADGWWLRSDIIWAKPNPMPESCTDRPTKAHEYIFLLTKSASYFYDPEAVKEDCCSGPSDIKKMVESKERIGGFYKDATDPMMKASSLTNIGQKISVGSPNGRNLRSVWTIATAPFPQAHFATFPPALPERCIKAGTSEKGCCPKCGAPWKRVVEKVKGPAHQDRGQSYITKLTDERSSRKSLDANGAMKAYTEKYVKVYTEKYVVESTTTGWAPTCACDTGEPVPCTVLDPFAGACTTLLVAARLWRYCIGIELSPDYVKMSVKRLKAGLGLFGDVRLIGRREVAGFKSLGKKLVVGSHFGL